MFGITILIISIVIDVLGAISLFHSRKLAAVVSNDSQHNKINNWLIHAYDSNVFYVLVALFVLVNLFSYGLNFAKLFSNSLFINNYALLSNILNLAVVNLINWLNSKLFFNLLNNVVITIFTILNYIELIIAIYLKFVTTKNPINVQLLATAVLLYLLILIVTLMISIIIELGAKSISQYLLKDHQTNVSSNLSANKLKYLFNQNIIVKTKLEKAKENQRILKEYRQERKNKKRQTKK